MESNKDESLKCLRISSESLSKGDYDRALRFASKSQKLYPSQEADDLTDLIERTRDSPPDANNYSQGNGVRHRRNSHSRTTDSKADSDEAGSVEPAYTSEQLEDVQRIKRSKDYYEILGVTKDATDSDLKKSYRKLALQFHPDKNKAPGATEAFKVIGNAYATLSDSSKRKQYNLYGEEESRSPRRRNGHFDQSHGFEADISPEDLFNMFFGGSAFTYTNRQTDRHRRQFTTTPHQRRPRQGEESALSAFFQLSPILFMVLLSLLSMALQGEDVYKLHSSQSYPHQKHTSNLKVPYYVKDGFSKAYTGRSLNKIEREIDGIFLSNLRNECYREQMQREQLRWRAKYQGDSKAYEQAGRMAMTSCNRLQEIYGEG